MKKYLLIILVLLSGCYKHFTKDNICLKVPNTMQTLPYDGDVVFFMSDSLKGIYLFVDKDSTYNRGIKNYAITMVSNVYIFLDTTDYFYDFKSKDSSFVISFEDEFFDRQMFTSIKVYRKDDVFYTLWVVADTSSSKIKSEVNKIVKSFCVK